MSRYPPPCDEAVLLMEPEDAPEGDFPMDYSYAYRKMMVAVPISAFSKEEWDKYRRQILNNIGKTMSEVLSARQ